ncbi:20414_t:CDS:10 [Entrophospora sp. SA101]|nr:20414_t:CDS:10 [Entrophospora sp. SA101]
MKDLSGAPRVALPPRPPFIPEPENNYSWYIRDGGAPGSGMNGGPASRGELTGDTHQAFVNDIKRCNIIVTTPEKWESVTRQWIKITEPIQKFTCSVLPEEFLGLDIHQTIILDCDSGNILFAPIESNEVASPNQNVDDISNNVQQEVIPVQTFEVLGNNNNNNNSYSLQEELFINYNMVDNGINVELISPRQTRPRTITTSSSTLSNKSKESLTVNSSKKSFELLPNGRVKCNHNCRDKQKCAHECCKIGCRRAPKNRKATNNNYNDNLRTSQSLISEGNNNNNSTTIANTNDNDHLLSNNCDKINDSDDKRGDIEMLLWSNEQKQDENLKKQDDDDGEPNTIGQDITEVEETFETFATPNYINKQQQKQRSIGQNLKFFNNEFLFNSNNTNDTSGDIQEEKEAAGDEVKKISRCETFTEALCIFDYVFNTIIE